MPITIRTVAPADLDGICEIETACFPAAEAATRAAFAARIEKFPRRFLVAEENGQLIGLINGCCTDRPELGDELYEPDCPHRETAPWQTVFGLAIKPEFQHRGIARQLMAALAEVCRENGQTGIILTCKAEKIGFYEAQGFSCRGKSASCHGGAVWYDMVRTF